MLSRIKSESKYVYWLCNFKSPTTSCEEIIQYPWKIHRIFRLSLKLEWCPENWEALFSQKICSKFVLHKNTTLIKKTPMFSNLVLVLHLKNKQSRILSHFSILQFPCNKINQCVSPYLLLDVRCTSLLLFGCHTCHKLWPEICEIRQIFKWDVIKILTKITLKLPQSSQRPLFICKKLMIKTTKCDLCLFLHKMCCKMVWKFCEIW